jgi:magnesium chelatase family protein
MSLAVVYCRAQLGLSAPLVTVETYLKRGDPGIIIVGLPETAVKESRDRVRSAIINSHFKVPTKKIIVNLAPADISKEGGRFDLPIALGILAASGQIPLAGLSDYEFAGELALSGELRAFKGALPFALAARRCGRKFILPAENSEQVALIQDHEILIAPHLLNVCEFLQGFDELQAATTGALTPAQYSVDMADVQEQVMARRALEVAAAGGHSLLMVGPPGAGKTMLATRLPTILPPLTQDEALEVAAVASLSQRGFNAALWQQRAFRAPHHTSSAVALVGGGNPPKPGEISLAHHGVLFLDELPEFNRHVLEVLREPLESGRITISRANHQAEFPAQFQLICAMNPCPCGYLGDARQPCNCTPEQIQRYQNKISGPLLDRIDMHVEVAANNITQFLSANKNATNETSAQIRERVVHTRILQLTRNGCANAQLAASRLSELCPLSAAAEKLLGQALEKYPLSARAYHRLMRLARTIADLSQSSIITDAHISEALLLRFMDRRKMRG